MTLHLSPAAVMSAGILDRLSAAVSRLVEAKIGRLVIATVRSGSLLVSGTCTVLAAHVLTVLLARRQSGVAQLISAVEFRADNTAPFSPENIDTGCAKGVKNSQGSSRPKSPLAIKDKNFI